jgi:hypothetical protein
MIFHHSISVIKILHILTGYQYHTGEFILNITSQKNKLDSGPILFKVDGEY